MNEITAIPELTQLLDIDSALGCQTAVPEQILERTGDYELALKAIEPQDLR